METISGCRCLKVNLKAKMLTLLPKGVQTKLLKFFWLKIFFHLLLTPVAHLEPRISPRIRNGRNGILRCLGETDSWKISWHCPFKSEANNLIVTTSTSTSAIFTCTWFIYSFNYNDTCFPLLTDSCHVTTHLVVDNYIRILFPLFHHAIVPPPPPPSTILSHV
jgi:hypothetical protein